MRLPSRRVLTALVVGFLALSAGSMVAAAGGDAQSADDEVRIIDEEITIKDATFQIEDTTLTGPGLPDKHVEDRTYTLEESSVHVNGLHINFRGTTYTICDVTITVKDIGVHLQDVTLKSA